MAHARAVAEQYGMGARYLDFGCGHGNFVSALMKIGVSDVHAFDFVKYPALDRLVGLRFYPTIDDIEASGQEFDVIRLHHVIEHLTDHEGTLRRLRDLLSPRGRIVGQTPNAAHYTSRLMRSAWGPTHYPYHTLIFSPPGMSALAERAGLALKRTTSNYLPTAWSITSENLIKRAFGMKTRGRLPIYSLLLAASAPFAFLDRWLTPAASANFDFELARR